MASQKSSYWQAVRGVCILLVILIHCPSGQSYGVMEKTSWILLRQVINWPVAGFVFMAGYFVNAMKVAESPKRYICARFQKLLIPFVFWSALYSAYNILLAIHRGKAVSFGQIAFQFFTGASAPPLYYILVMLQLTLLTPWLCKALRHKPSRFFLYGITPVYLLGLYLYNFIYKTPPPRYGTFFPAWLFFYILGMDCRRNRPAGKASRLDIVGCLLALMAACLEALLLKQNGCSDAFAVSQIRFTCFLHSTLVLLGLCKRAGQNPRSSQLSKALCIVGDCSYGIFYSHYFVLRIVEWLLCRMGLDSVWALYWSLTFVLTSLASVCVVQLARRLAAKLPWGERLVQWVGFA